MSDEQRIRDLDPLEPPLESAVEAVRAERAPEDAVERVKASARQLAITGTSNQLVSDARRSGRSASRLMVASLAMAATLLAVVTGITLLPDHSSGRVFAQMIEQVRTAGTVRFTTATRFGHQPPIDGKVYLAFNRMRIEQFGGSLVQVANVESRQALILDTVDDKFQQVDSSGPLLGGWGTDPIDQLRRVKANDAESIGQEILRGRRTEVYRLRHVDLLGIKGNLETLVWVDVESELPAKIVIRESDPKHPLEFLLDDFVWNEPLDAQLFSLDVPQGFKPGIILLEPQPRQSPTIDESAPAFVDGVLRDRAAASLYWSPDGATITALMRDPESVPLLERLPSELRQWHVATGQLLWSEEVAGANWLARTPDGETLAIVIGYEVQLRDAASGKVKQRWATDERLSPLAFSPDGKTLAAGITRWGPYGGGGGEVSGGVQFWDVERGTLATSIADDKPTTFVGYSADGKYLATSSNDGPVKLWETSSGELIRIFPGRQRASFSPDGDLIACPSAASSADKAVGKVDLYNLVDGSLVRSFTSEKGASASWLLDVTFSPDGRSLAAADWNGTVTLWEVATGDRRRTIPDHDEGVLAAVFASDGATLATGSEDKTLRLWDLEQPIEESGKRPAR